LAVLFFSSSHGLLKRLTCWTYELTNDWQLFSAPCGKLRSAFSNITQAAHNATNWRC
jgi:hypothetical protein